MSDDRLDANGMAKTPSDEGSNPLKRRNTDAGAVDYPRRRATIAVCSFTLNPPRPASVSVGTLWRAGNLLGPSPVG
jgi:hypothetical protein